VVQGLEDDEFHSERIAAFVMYHRLTETGEEEDDDRCVRVSFVHYVRWIDDWLGGEAGQAERKRKIPRSSTIFMPCM
jgi:hypothetical protein